MPNNFRPFILSVCVLLFLSGEGEMLMANMAKENQIRLPTPATQGAVSVEEAILKRRSQRAFRADDLTLEQIGQVLWAAQGITDRKNGFAFRSAPSAGALYPMEIYVIKKDGVFHYVPDGHLLEKIQEKDLRQSLAQASGGQGAIAQAPMDIIICAVYERVTTKYGERGIRYAHMEAGHIAENIHLQAKALGLDSLAVGAFNDQRIKEICAFPPKQEPVYIIPVGYKK